MIKIEQRKKKYFKKVDDKYKKLYLIHHMHHFKSAKDAVHELHHCFLFSKKDMKGKRYSIVHEIDKDKVYHCISEQFEGKLYDHANNIWKIVVKKINKKKIYEIKF